MKELLIIRSVSFQQLDLNLMEINKKFPDYKISLLTHEHGVKLAEKYSLIDNIYVYPYRGAFKSGNEVNELKDKVFDVLITPVTNISGSGFLNVLNYSRSIKSKSYYMCNLISDIEEYDKGRIISKKILNNLYILISGILSLPLLIISLIYLPFKLKSLKIEE
jgi:hypothetical protein